MKKTVLRSLTLLPVLLNTAIAAEQTLDTDPQKASYALGVELMKSLAKDNLSLDKDAFLQGVNDMEAKQELRLAPAELQKAKDWLVVERVKFREVKAAQNLAVSRAFLDNNAKQPGIHSLPDGAQYQVLEAGKQGAHPSLEDGVLARYRLSNLADKELQRSDAEAEAKPLILKNLIKGWQDVLPLMTVGAKWRLFLPPELGYGENGTPDGKIGLNEALVYDLELLSIVPGAANNPELSETIKKISVPASK